MGVKVALQAVPAPRGPKAIFVLNFLGGFLILVAVIISALAVKDTMHLHTVLTTWPSADAQVIHCYEQFAPLGRNQRKQAATACELRFFVNGQWNVATTRTAFSAPDR